MASNNNFLQPQLPPFNGKNYHQCSTLMKVLYESQDMWQIIENGFTNSGDANLTTQQLNELKDNRKKDKKALFFIFQSVDPVIFERISTEKTSKEAWDSLKRAYLGEDKIKLVRLQFFRSEFDNLRMKESESIEEYFNRVISIVNQIKVNGENIEEKMIIEKILRSLTRKFEHIVVAIEESKDLTTLPLESLLASLQSHELRIKQFDSPALEHAFQTQVSVRCGNVRGRGRGQISSRGRGRYHGTSKHGKKEFEYSHEQSRFARGRGRGRSRGRGRGRNSSQIQCYGCHYYGHTMKYCPNKITQKIVYKTHLLY